MRRPLLSRLEQLEARSVTVEPVLFRCGWFFPLPTDYVGERHTVIVSRESDDFDREWCHFEERPGAGPGDVEEDFRIYLTPEPGANPPTGCR